MAAMIANEALAEMQIIQNEALEIIIKIVENLEEEVRLLHKLIDATVSTLESMDSGKLQN